jgi:hypothetical protein
MELKCEEVWHDISDYVDGELDVTLRQNIARHIATCRRCTAVYSGTLNIVQLYGDERMFSIPTEFVPALRRRLSARLSPERGSVYAWTLSLAGAGLVAATLLIFSLPQFAAPGLRAPMSEPALKAAYGMVAITDEGKTFHVPGCTYLHGKTRMIPVEDALRQGYNPCIRCESELLHQAELEHVTPAEAVLAGE